MICSAIKPISAARTPLLPHRLWIVGVDAAVFRKQVRHVYVCMGGYDPVEGVPRLCAPESEAVGKVPDGAAHRHHMSCRSSLFFIAVVNRYWTNCKSKLQFVQLVRKTASEFINDA